MIGRLHGRVCVVLSLGLVVALTGCSTLLDPQQPAVASPSAVPSVAHAPHENAAVAATTTLASRTPTSGNHNIIQHYGLYPTPASCMVTPMTDQEERRSFPGWWVEGDGLAAGTPIGALFAGEFGNKVQWQFATPVDRTHFTIKGTRLDGTAPALDATINLIGGFEEDIGDTFSSGLIFPAPGCWEVQGEARPHGLTATVYVYPAECGPEELGDVGAKPQACTVPQ